MMAYCSPADDVEMHNDKGKGKAVADCAKDGMPWVEKYRPMDLDGVLSQPDIISTSIPDTLN